jgi:hypothetical protein
LTDEEDVVAGVVRLLNEAGIPHMVAGSLASSFHGRPRTTHDADLVIDPDAAALDRLVAGLAASGFYVDAGVARDALRTRRQFNAIAPKAAFKVDLIVRKDRPFSREEFQRRRPANLAGAATSVATPEDTILAKLEWARQGGSERQLEDAAGIVEVQGRSLDRAYIERWAAVLGVVEEWRRIADGRLGPAGS